MTRKEFIKDYLGRQEIELSEEELKIFNESSEDESTFRIDEEIFSVKTREELEDILFQRFIYYADSFINECKNYSSYPEFAFYLNNEELANYLLEDVDLEEQFFRDIIYKTKEYYLIDYIE